MSVPGKLPGCSKIRSPSRKDAYSNCVYTADRDIPQIWLYVQWRRRTSKLPSSRAHAVVCRQRGRTGGRRQQQQQHRPRGRGEKKRESTTAGFSSDLLRCRPVAAGDKVWRWRLAWQEDNARLMGTLGREGGWRVGRGRREDICGAVVNMKKTTANKTSRRVLSFP